MERIFTKILGIVLILVMVLSMVACGSSTTPDSVSTSTLAAATTTDSTTTPVEQPVTLKIYAQYSDEDTKAPYDYAIAAMKKDMPNVTLELDILAQDDNAKLKTYAATGNLPDVFQSGGDIINTLKASNNILMLDDQAPTADFKSKMQPSAMNTLMNSDGHIWAYPYAGNELVLLYYNKDLFTQFGVKVPTTVDELIQAAKTFNSKNITPLSIFSKEKWVGVSLFDCLATRMEPTGIRKLDTNQGKASDEAFTWAAQKFAELAKAGLFQKGATNTNNDQAESLFLTGKAAMFLNGQWEIATATEKMGDKVDWMAFPGKDAANYEEAKNNFSGGGGPGGYSVSPNSKNKDMAVKVAAYISFKYAECKYTTRGTPIVATKVNAPMVEAFPPMMEKLAKVIPDIKSFGSFDWNLTNAKFKVAIEDATQKLVTGGYTADEFVKDMDKAIVNANAE
ncbi:MAG TPA: extracellular solute-binding protein [Ruminiclostridium sp.]